MDEPVKIIGCGPAAMMVAHACWEAGADFVMYAPERLMSPLGGAQYLHREIPGLSDMAGDAFDLNFIFLGTEGGYERKIYGALPAGLRSSWGKFPDQVRAWPLVATYRYAWARYSRFIETRTVALEDMLHWSHRHIVFNTAPLPHIMPLANYESEGVYIYEGFSRAGLNQIIYSGNIEDDWYRTSNINGKQSTEYPGHFGKQAPVPGLKLIRKPLRTDVSIPGVHLVGRYGRWEKGVLVDDAFFQAKEVLEGADWDQAQRV